MASIKAPQILCNYQDQITYENVIQKLTCAKPNKGLMIDDQGHIYYAGKLRLLWEKIKGFFGAVNHTLSSEIKLRAISILEYGIEHKWLTVNKVRGVVQRLEKFSCESDEPLRLYMATHIRAIFKELYRTLTKADLNKYATKIQSLFRGHSARNAVVLPGQILPFLQKHLLGGHDQGRLFDIARGLCREINEMATHRAKYKGKSAHLEQVAPKYYPFPVFGARGKYEGQKAIKLSFDCWIEMSESGDEIKLLIVPEENAKFDAGSYKDVFKAQSFDIPLMMKKKGSRELNYEPKVLAKVLPDAYEGKIRTYEQRVQSLVEEKGKTSNPSKIKAYEDKITAYQKKIKELVEMTQADNNKAYEKKVKAVKKGVKLHQQLIESLPEGKFAGIARERLPSAGGAAAAEGYEITQEWYNASLHYAGSHKAMPLDFSEVPKMRSLSSADLFNCIVDVAKTIEQMHSVGIIHRDIKPANILLKVTESGPPEGFVSDFDLISQVGKDSIESEYDYWDKCCRKGYVTTFADCYGLAMTLGDAMIPHFWKIRQEPGLLNKKPEELKLGAFTESLNGVLGLDNPLQNEFESCKTPKAVLNKVESLLNPKSKRRLTVSEIEELSKLKVELKGIDLILSLISEVVQQDHAQYNFLQAHPELQMQLQKGSVSAKQEVAALLQSHCFSAAEFRERLEDIQKTYTTYT